MNILMVNWGWPPRQTGGPIGYAADLCKQLAKYGHQVHMFYGGDSNFKGKCYLEYREEEKVNLASLVNSPNRYSNFGLPLNECKQPTVEYFFEEFLDEAKPELVHFHSLIGLSGSLIGLAKKKGITTIVSLHNYWFICPRGDFLIPPDYRLCTGPDGGLNCSICIPTKTKAWKRRVENVTNIIKAQLKRNVRLKRRLQKIVLNTNKLKNRFIPSEIEEGGGRYSTSPPDPLMAWGYKFRQEYLSDQLFKNADLMIAVSNSVKDIFVQNGISENKIMVLHSGIKMAERLEDFARENDIQLRNPLIFGFFGPVQPYKGVHVLVEAFSKLPLGSARLLIYGTGPSRYYQSLMNKANSQVEFKGAFDDLTQMLAEFDVAVVPPIWPDNAPLVVLEALSAKKPIIGANIGGIPDFVQDEVNGLLFKAGEVGDLAKKMMQLVKNPKMVLQFKSNIRRAKTMEEHAQELQQVYEKLIQREMAISSGSSSQDKEKNREGEVVFPSMQTTLT